MIELNEIKHVLIDFDGVLFYGIKANERIRDFFSMLRAKNISFIILSNSSIYDESDFVRILKSAGVKISKKEVLPICKLVSEYIKSIKKGANVFVIGSKSFKTYLQNNGMILVKRHNDKADFVIVGKDHELTYKKLLNATLLIRSGAKFIGSNGDYSAPCEFGIGPGNGATLAFLEASTNIKPIILGKPSTVVIERAIKQMGGKIENTAIIGDRLETDILGGQRVGIKTIYINCGINSTEEMKILNITPPDIAYFDIGELTDLWRR